MSEDSADEADAVQLERAHPKRPGPWPKGRSGNPSGLPGPERRIARAVSEVFRDKHSPDELADVLWAIAAGVDPFAKQRARAANPDNLPVLGSTDIDWQHRMAAIKMYAEYALGKPVQGVVVDAQVQQQIALSATVQQGPIDFGSMPPEVRAALRLAAAAALGKPLPSGPTSGQSRLPGAIEARCEERPRELAPQATESRARVAAPDVDLGDAGQAVPVGVTGEVVEIGDVEAKVEAVEGVAHEPSVGADLFPVKPMHVEFRGSSNLFDATLENGVATVRFRVAGGGVGRSYRYTNVTVEMMRAWRDAPSAGAWFAREIRNKPRSHPVIADPPPRVPGVVL